MGGLSVVHGPSGAACRDGLFYNMVLCYIILYDTSIVYHVISYYVIIVYDVILCYIMLYYVIVCYSML